MAFCVGIPRSNYGLKAMGGFAVSERNHSSRSSLLSFFSFIYYYYLLIINYYYSIILSSLTWPPLLFIYIYILKFIHILCMWIVLKTWMWSSLTQHVLFACFLPFLYIHFSNKSFLSWIKKFIFIWIILFKKFIS